MVTFQKKYKNYLRAVCLSHFAVQQNTGVSGKFSDIF